MCLTITTIKGKKKQPQISTKGLRYLSVWWENLLVMIEILIQSSVNVLYNTFVFYANKKFVSLVKKLNF